MLPTRMSSRTARIGRLSVVDHDRDAAGMRYVYPVVSRRAGGVSLGINLSPNNACNWRCVYCQVPGLTAGKGPPIELELLKSELGELLEDVVVGDFLLRSAPEGARRLNDIAFSGNGEPTSSPDLAGALDVVAEALGRHDLLGRTRVVLITNGSLVGKPAVLETLGRLAAIGGEVWFKLDSATCEGLRRVNGCTSSPEVHLARLRTAARACPTWIQTCWYSRRGELPSAEELAAHFDSIAELVRSGVPLEGVQLYTLARPSHQPEASELGPVSEEWLSERAQRISELGLRVNVSA